MTRLFSEKWMELYAKAWNEDKEIAGGLASIKFDANIGYGFIDEYQPRGILVVQDGKVEYAGEYQGQPLDWDLRARLEDWKQWLETGFGLTRLGVAVAGRKLRFAAGDYRRMLRTPSMAGPFLRSFELMGKVKTDFRLS